MEEKKEEIFLLEEIYNQDQLEKELMEEKVIKNEKKILEIEFNISSLQEKEYQNNVVFSPRLQTNLYDKNISLKENEKNQLKEKNNEMEDKIKILEDKINKIELIMKKINEKDTCREYDLKEKNCSILEIQEMERRRIAREIHDSTVQNLVHLIHKNELCGKFMDKDLIRAKMEIVTINKCIKDIINDMRDIIFNLRPMEFDDIGVSSVFDKLFLDLKKKTDIKIKTEIEEINNIGEIKGITIFHIIKECCNNAIKHSKAENLFVSMIQKDSHIYINIKDDGIGFDIEEKFDHHFGIAMVKERIDLLAGYIKFNSIINQGTNIEIVIPEDV